MTTLLLGEVANGHLADITARSSGPNSYAGRSILHTGATPVFADVDAVFQATKAATDRAPVIPTNPSRSISATMSTMRPSIARVSSRQPTPQ